VAIHDFVWHQAPVASWAGRGAIMTEQDKLATLTRILRDLLGDDSIDLAMDTVREDVPGWDSFSYVNFIVAVEAEYKMKFRIADIESFPNVGAIVRAVDTVSQR
jgi:acyl carrier protein